MSSITESTQYEAKVEGSRVHLPCLKNLLVHYKSAQKNKKKATSLSQVMKLIDPVI